MTLDTASLRVLFTAVAVTMLALMYVAIYRRTCAAYAGWWCLSLALFVIGNALFLLDHTTWQWLANPAGNVAAVAGAVAVWLGARSLRAIRAPLSALLAGPVIVAVTSALDHPSTNTWSGGPFFLAAMAAYFTLASADIWRLRAEVPGRTGEDEAVYGTLMTALAIASSVVAAFYVARWAAFISAGKTSQLFSVWLGSQTATIVTTILLVVVSFTMTSLSHEQRFTKLQQRANHDSLTGLLNRAEFFAQARKCLTAGHGTHGGVLIMADLDFFKEINDRFGHSAGDSALRAFAHAWRSVLRRSDVIGRVGGEEFAILLPDGEVVAEQVAQRISHRYRHSVPLASVEPTVSYGIAQFGPDSSLEDLMSRADAALYRAKASGRDRAVRDAT